VCASLACAAESIRLVRWRASSASASASSTTGAGRGAVRRPRSSAAIAVALIRAAPEAGFTVDAPSAFASNVTSVAVHDPARERAGWPVVRAFVYADSAAAAQARSSEQILAGYGTPTWWGNVALIQVSQDPAAFPQDVNCVPAPVDGTPRVLNGVDEAFVSLLSTPMARLHSAE
jgi:hypothetical protein